MPAFFDVRATGTGPQWGPGSVVRPGRAPAPSVRGVGAQAPAPQGPRRAPGRTEQTRASEGLEGLSYGVKTNPSGVGGAAGTRTAWSCRGSWRAWGAQQGPMTTTRHSGTGGSRAAKQGPAIRSGRSGGGPR